MHGRMWLLGGGTYDTPDRPKRLFYNEVWSSADGVNWRKDATAPWAPRQVPQRGRLRRQDVGHGRRKYRYARLQPAMTSGYSPDGVNWTELAGTPWPTRHAGTAFVHDGHLWMVAGSHPGSTPINDVWRLDKVEDR